MGLQLESSSTATKHNLISGYHIQSLWKFRSKSTSQIMSGKSGLNYGKSARKASDEVPIMSHQETDDTSESSSSSESDFGSDDSESRTAAFYRLPATYQAFNSNDAISHTPALDVRESPERGRPGLAGLVTRKRLRSRAPSPHPSKLETKDTKEKKMDRDFSEPKFSMDVDMEVNPKTVIRKDEKRWRPGMGQAKYTTKHYQKFYMRNSDPFGRNNCGFRDIPYNRVRFDDYILQDLNGWKTQSFRTHFWRLGQFIAFLLVSLLIEEYCREDTWAELPFGLLITFGVAWFCGFMITHYAGLAMICHNLHVKNHPEKFMPKNPHKLGSKRLDETERRKKLEKHVVSCGHRQAMLEKAKKIEEHKEQARKSKTKTS